jgi:peroxiredoxin
MSSQAHATLKAKFDALQAERERCWSPEDLAGNIAQRRELVAEFAARRLATAGDRLPAADLVEVNGGPLDLARLLREGPVVLVFFRFAGCPACNIALPHYAQSLAPEARRRGSSVIAVSPQVADRLVEIKRRHDLPFLVATDVGNGLAAALNITFAPSQEQAARLAAAGKAPIRETTGAGDDRLPAPAVVIVRPDGRIGHVDVTPDWLARTETPDIVSALDRIIAPVG